MDRGYINTTCFVWVNICFLLWVGGGRICWPWENCGEDIYVNKNTAVNEGGNTTDINRAVQTGIVAGAVLIRAYRDDQRAVDRLTKGLELAKESEVADNIKRSEQALDDGRKRRDITFQIYVDQLKKSAEYPMQENREQLEALKKQLNKRKEMKPFERFAELFVSQIDAYKRNNTADEGKIDGQILEQP